MQDERYRESLLFFYSLLAAMCNQQKPCPEGKKDRCPFHGKKTCEEITEDDWRRVAKKDSLEENI